MLAGLWFFRRDIARRIRFNLGPRRQWKAYTAERRRRDDEGRVDNIDSILEKISAKGYEKLTPTEKRILENYSRQRRNNSE
jgi:hypothetical protein